jgi:hypothetical protein
MKMLSDEPGEWEMIYNYTMTDMCRQELAHCV